MKEVKVYIESKTPIFSIDSLKAIIELFADRKEVNNELTLTVKDSVSDETIKKYALAYIKKNDENIFGNNSTKYRVVKIEKKEVNED